jgi:hypothetical protein
VRLFWGKEIRGRQFESAEIGGLRLGFRRGWRDLRVCGFCEIWIILVMGMVPGVEI